MTFETGKRTVLSVSLAHEMDQKLDPYLSVRFWRGRPGSGAAHEGRGRSPSRPPPRSPPPRGSRGRPRPSDPASPTMATATAARAAAPPRAPAAGAPARTRRRCRPEQRLARPPVQHHPPRRVRQRQRVGAAGLRGPCQLRDVRDGRRQLHQHRLRRPRPHPLRHRLRLARIGADRDAARLHVGQLRFSSSAATPGSASSRSTCAT